jgi:hypothetical protein
MVAGSVTGGQRISVPGGQQAIRARLLERALITVRVEGSALESVSSLGRERDGFP